MERVTLNCPCCGAELRFAADGITLSCEYCGHTEYWKEKKTEKVISALDRANALRRANRFSDAIMEYRLITEQYPDDAEAHWGLVLSLYGIEFVKDPRTNRFLPTCHRTVRESILESANYLKAVECASEVQSEEYKNEAIEIDRLQKEILKLSDAEEEYDVFISFKSTDEKGRITRDAQIARIIYDELVKRKVKTFFSDVTLEGKLFSAFEPIIYRALFSCKFFILVGTKDEFIHSPWVKNEWSRFEERMETEKLSGVACAVFDGAEVKNLPPFARTQGIDLRRYAAGGYEIHVADAVEKKLGRKKMSKEEEMILQQIEAQKQAQRELEERLKGLQQGSAESTGGASATVNSLLMRARQELEVKSFDNARDYYGRVLDADPKNADAWWGLFLVDLKATDDKTAELTIETKKQYGDVLHNRNFVSAQKYATGNTVKEIESFRSNLETEGALLPRAEEFLKNKEFDRTQDICNLLLASEPENAKAWWLILLSEEKCPSEKEFLEKCEWNTTATTVRRASYKNAYNFAQDEFREHLLWIRKKTNEKFMSNAQGCRDKIVALNNETEYKKQQFAAVENASEREVDAANGRISQVYNANPILKKHRDKGKKKVPVRALLITAGVLAVLFTIGWCVLEKLVFTKTYLTYQSNPPLYKLITWNIGNQVFGFPLFIIQAIIYGALFMIGFWIVLLILSGIIVGSVNAANRGKRNKFAAAHKILDDATKDRDRLQAKLRNLRQENDNALKSLDRRRNAEQKKLENYERFLEGKYADMKEYSAELARAEAATAKDTGNKAPASKKGKKESKTESKAKSETEIKNTVVKRCAQCGTTVTFSTPVCPYCEGTNFHGVTDLELSGRWHVGLVDCGENKIEVVKILRNVLDCNLGEAVVLAEQGGVVKEDLDIEEAALMADDLRAVGASVNLESKII